MASVPELSYVFNKDQKVYRKATLTVGRLSLAVQAVTVNGYKQRANQDTFGFSKGEKFFCAAVFDGANSGKASHKAKDLLENSQGDLPASVLLSSINKKLGLFDLGGAASTGTIVEITEAGELNIAHVTDSWSMVLFRDGSTKLLTTDQHQKFDSKCLNLLAQIATITYCCQRCHGAFGQRWRPVPLS